MASSVSATAMMRAIKGISSPLQAVRVAAAVDVLVVQLDARQHFLQLCDRTHDVRAFQGMLLH